MRSPACTPACISIRSSVLTSSAPPRRSSREMAATAARGTERVVGTPAAVAVGAIAAASTAQRLLALIALAMEAVNSGADIFSEDQQEIIKQFGIIKSETVPENKDSGSDDADDGGEEGEDDETGDADADDGSDDAGEDFSGEEGGEDDDNEKADPDANGEGGSDHDDDGDGEDGQDDDDEEAEEEEEEDEDQPPS